MCRSTKTDGVSTVTATLSGPSSETVTVTISATAVARAAATDFTLAGTTLTIAAGQTGSTEAVTITAANNTMDSPNKTVEVTGTVTGGNDVAAPAARTLTIVDDEGAPTVTLVLDPVSIDEDRGVSTVTATLSGPSSAQVTSLALTRNRAVRDVDLAWRNHFAGCSRRPRPKRSTDSPSFYLHNQSVRFEGEFAEVQKPGTLRLARAPRYPLYRVQGVTVRYEHGRWHISIVRDRDRQRQRAPRMLLGSTSARGRPRRPTERGPRTPPFAGSNDTGSRQASVGSEADLLQILEVAQPAADIEIVRVVDHRLGAQRAVLPCGTCLMRERL